MKRKTDLTIFTKHWLLKLLSLIIGASLWYFAVGEDQVNMTVTIPLEVVNLPRDLVIANQYKKDIEVNLRGPKRLIQETRQQNISRPVDLSKAQPGSMVVQNDSTSIRFPQGISVQRVQPSSITLLVDKLVQRDLTITPVTKGKPAAGFTLEKVAVNPAHIQVSGPQTVLGKETTLKTHAITLDGLDHSAQFQVHLNLSEALLQLIGETVIEANITVQESLVKKTVRNIPVNIREPSLGSQSQPATVAVEANIPEQIVQATPELSMLFRAVVTGPASAGSNEFPVQVTAVNLPGHAPVAILTITPDKVQIRR